MSTGLFASTRPLRGVTAARRVVARADKEAALKQLRESQAGTAARLAGVEAELKRSSTVASAASASADPQVSAPAPTGEGLEEIDQFNYYDKIKGAGTPLVVIDFFTEWCGPCKIMYPRLVEMKHEMAGQVTFYKFNCNKKNKELGVELGIKVAPTFFVYKGGEKVASMTGAKVDELRSLISSSM